jgi:hypothetical protein
MPSPRSRERRRSRCCPYLRDRGKATTAARYAEQLGDLAPDDPAVQELVKSLPRADALPGARRETRQK